MARATRLMSSFLKFCLIISILSTSCFSGKNQEEVIKTKSLGVVSSASPEASNAGQLILNKGGNAVDAAIAVQFALAVTEPAMSGLGGGTQVLMALPGQSPIAINGASISPGSTPTDATKDDLKYHRRSTIPSTVKVLGYLYEKYGSGTVSWKELIEPAIGYAEDGFSVGEFRHKVYRQYQSSLENSPFNTSYFLMPDGNIPAPGDTLKQPVLAETLRRISKDGADDFYNGKIAREIAEDMSEQGGWISLDDLNNFPDPIELDPVSTEYRGFTIYSQPPPCGGWTALLALNILEGSSAEDLQPGTRNRFNNVLTALHLAHQDRKQNPVIDENDLKSRIDKDYASSLLQDFKMHPGIGADDAGETTHFSVIDSNGYAIAVTSSINAYFGAAAATEGLGILYNTYMNDFEVGKPDHPFAIGPGKMNYSSMSPTIVQKNGETKLIIGSPGSARIISSVAQLIQLWVDTDLSLEEIVEYPRLHSVNGKIYYEDLSIPNQWLETFRNQNFEIAFPSYYLSNEKLNAYFGGIHAIAFENDKWVGASDPRRDGSVTYAD